MRPMRIGFVAPEFVTERYFSGGLANYLYRISKTLASFGHEIHIITFSEIDQAEFDYERVRIHRVSASRPKLRLRRLNKEKLNELSQWIKFSFKVYMKLKKLHSQKPFDIVQYTNFRACGLFSSLLLRIPYVLRCSSYSPAWHQLAGIRRKIGIRVLEHLEKLQLHLSRNIYTPSVTLKQMLIEKEQIAGIRVIRTPFYLETSEWDTAVYDEKLRGKSYLLFFGRFQLSKGFHVLAQALPTVLKMLPECYAVFVGLDQATTLARSMKDYALYLCSNHVERLVFFGQMHHEHLYPIIAGAHLVVLPSLIDNMPNTCLEAMGLGKPVIGTTGASFEEIITEGETGFLVPTANVDALSSKIVEAWRHPNLNAIGRAACRKVQEYSPQRTAVSLLEYYGSLVLSSEKVKIGE